MNAPSDVRSRPKDVENLLSPTVVLKNDPNQVNLLILCLMLNLVLKII